ncbi:MAG: ATP-binding cassette domain-containing protein [Prevotella sp.]|jgi:ABC-2 type transport system ATP-binding protein
MIKVKNLSFKYKLMNDKVLDYLNFALEPNHIYGLLGKNGEGKTTLLQLMSGLLKPDVGEVDIDGINSFKRDPRTLANLYLMPEEPSFPQLTYKQFVAMHEDFYPNFSRDTLEKCLADFEVDAHKNLSSYSMGQRKKVFLSFALAAHTPYLLLDEPTNGLDISSKTSFRKIVAGNMSEDQLIVISTHLVHDVEQLLDYILLLDHQSLIVESSISDITNKYIFCERQHVEGDETVVYSEPSLHGFNVMALRQEGDEETEINLELFFNAMVKGAVQ